MECVAADTSDLSNQVAQNVNANGAWIIAMHQKRSCPALSSSPRRVTKHNPPANSISAYETNGIRSKIVRVGSERETRQALPRLADLQNEAEVFRFGIPRLLMLRPLANPLNDTTNPMKTIEVTISPTGEVKIDAIGFKGTACDTACAEIERALGKVTQRTNKPEYQQPQQQKIGQ